jgi:type I restriction enzyme S subunit
MDFVPLGTVASVKSGFAFKSKDWRESGVPVIKIANVKDGFLNLEGCSFVDDALARGASAFELKPGDILISMTGYIGEVAKVRNEGRMLLNQRVGKFSVKDLSRLDNDFLFYCLRDPELKAKFALNAYGAAQPNISPSLIEQQLVPLPTLSTQHRIASILSTYDDLIENCQRRIKILEAMARGLYREWFVHFRFPGHENHPRVASPLGEIPEGWEAIPFERLLASMTGGDWGSEQSEDRETEAVVVVRGTDFDEVAYGSQLRAPVRYIKPSSLVSRVLKVGDVIIENSINAKSRSVGTTLLVDEHVLNRLGQDAIAASFCKVLRPHDQKVAPLIHLHARHLREDARMEYYQNVAANGIANFQAQKFSREEHLVLPADEGECARLVAPIAAVLNNIASLASRVANLRRTRDLLLPRLLSGQIELDDLEAA